MVTKEQVLEELKVILNENFEIEPENVTLDSNVVTDLDLDSIDAIDMVAEVQRRVGCRLTAQDFKAVKTIGDIIDIIVKKVNE